MRHLNERMYKTFDECHTKRVSYILTTKNRPDFLRTTLEHIKTLLTSDDELLIIDGGSGADVYQVLKEYSDMIQEVVSEPDISLAHALNKGILLAQGNYIRHITDDDVMHANGIEQAIAVMESHPEVDLLICGGIKQVKKKYAMVCLSPNTNYGKNPKDVFIYGASGAGFVIRRSVFAKVGLFSLKEAADTEFAARCIYQKASVKFSRINLYHHPIYPHSVIMSKSVLHTRDRYRIMRQYCSTSFYVKHRILAYIMAIPHISFLWKKSKKLLGMKSKWNPLPVQYDQHVWDGGFS